jgi:hypothetical protein
LLRLGGCGKSPREHTDLGANLDDRVMFGAGDTHTHTREHANESNVWCWGESLKNQGPGMFNIYGEYEWDFLEFVPILLARAHIHEPVGWGAEREIGKDVFEAPVRVCEVECV